MIISAQKWDAFIAGLRAVNEAAAGKITDFLKAHPVYTEEDMRRLLDYAYGVATRYGEAAAELACEMYDAAGIASGMHLADAEPAPTATYGETAKAVRGAMNRGGDEMAADAVGRLVKQAGVDTTMQNALRDGAEWAWVPRGDTCAFCLMLASNGWQRASRKALKNGHAEHIHANCDCTYAVRFDSAGGVAGYAPETYRAMYDGAEGRTWEDKLNAMRREQYAENAPTINAQKRAAYARRREKNET